jgi:hypothetical protein
MPGVRLAGLLTVQGMRGGAVSRTRQPSHAAQALQVLGLIIYRSPAGVRARFREQLHARNLADPGDPCAPRNAVRSWSRPDLYVQCFTAIMDDLDRPERALAREAIDALATTGADRRPRPGSDPSQQAS